MSQNGVKLGLESYGINLYEHSEFRNEHRLDGVGANGKAFISEFVDNLVKTILVNGIVYTPLYSDGSTMLTEFPIGAWVTFTQDENSKKIIFNLPAPQGMQMKLVWKNASPASTFPPQSVIIDMQNYDTLLINCTLGANLVVRKGNTSSVMVSTGFNYYRGIICNEYGVIFDNCGYFANYGNFTQTICLLPLMTTATAVFGK